MFKYETVNIDDINFGDKWSTLLLKSVKPARELYKKLINEYNDQPYDRYEKWIKKIGYEPFNTELDWYVHLCDSYHCSEALFINLTCEI